MALRFVLAHGQPRERLDKVLARLVPDRSRSTIQRWIGEGRVQVDGQVCRAPKLVAAGAVIDVEPGPPPASRAEADPSVTFGVVYEDSQLVVVDKPAGLVVHPARGHAQGTLVSGLLARAGFGRPPADALDPDAALRPGIVHRIDKDTSGLLVVAKDAPTREHLKRQFSEHTIERVYRAITVGVPQVARIETHYGRHPRQRLKFTSLTDSGRMAVTHFSVLEVLSVGRAAYVECRLETGRTHQIRVHASEQARTPLLGDALYGGRGKDPELRSVAEQLGRQALHAAVLGFVHPQSGQSMRFESDLPEDMRTALAALRSS